MDAAPPLDSTAELTLRVGVQVNQPHEVGELAPPLLFHEVNWGWEETPLPLMPIQLWQSRELTPGP